MLPILLGGTSAHAQKAQESPAEAAEETIRLAVRAPEGCPSATDFEARVHRAAPHVRVTTRDENVRLFTVDLAVNETARGRLSITKDDAPLGTRDVTGASCDDVANILAFAVALAVDPNALPLAPTPNQPKPEPPPVVVQQKPAPATSSAPPRPPAGTPSRTSWGIAVHAFGASGLAPSTTFGAGISAEIARTMGTLAPALRLGIEYGVSAPVASDGARVTFADALVLFEVCPTTFDVGPVALRPCARVDGGARIIASEDIPGAHGVTRPWLDVGPMIHLRARMKDPVFIAIEGGPIFPLLRDRVYFSPEITVHDAPVIAARGEIVVGLAFR